MLQKLFEIEALLPEILNGYSVKYKGLMYAPKDIIMKSMFIDYHAPMVERIWFQLGDLRVYFHKIHPCKCSDALFHPHPWESAIRVIEESYEMGIGHSPDDNVPPIDCKLILKRDTSYEMSNPDGWHYVAPLRNPSYSLMITGEKFTRTMPVEPDKSFRELTILESENIISVFKNYYHQVL
jgi:hypothetical protein